MKLLRSLPILLALPALALATEVCEVTTPMAALNIPHVKKAPGLNTDPHSPTWKHASSAWIIADCSSKNLDYPKLKTEVRAFYTDTDLYLLFVSPYTELNLWLPPDPTKDHLKLWDRDVVEFFLGDDWTDIIRTIRRCTMLATVGTARHRIKQEPETTGH
jgi:hypothetical protein